VSEVSPKIFEYEIYEIRLHLRRQLLVEWKLLEDQVVIVFECLLDRLRHAQVQVSGDVELIESRVGLLQLLDPEV